MDAVVDIAVTLIGIVVFVQAVGLVINTARLIKMPLRAPLTEVVATGAVPEEIRTALDAARPILEQQGFTCTGMTRVRPVTAFEHLGYEYCANYYSAVHDVHASVQLASLPTPHWPFDVYLWNFYTDGRALLSVNGLAHLLIPYPASVTVTDDYQPGFEGHVAAHLRARSAIDGDRVDAKRTPELARELAAHLLRELEREGSAYRYSGEPDPVYGFRLFTAIKMAWRMRRHAALRKRMASRAAGRPALEFASTVRETAERVAFTRVLATLDVLRAPRWFRWLALGVSAAGFLALGAWWWGVYAALAIGGVILVHEAGHWLAMKLAGFRDVQVFFVPGLGGATSGEKHEASPLTHLFVYLAGPLPGLLLALAAYAWLVVGGLDMASGLGRVVAVAALVSFLINLLNLAPVLPLDGGRIVDLFVVARLPWLRFIFSVGSGVALLYAGFSTEDHVLRGLGVLLLLFSAHHYRVARASAALLRAPKAEAAPLLCSAVAGLHRLLMQPRFAKWDHNVRVGVGTMLLPRLLGRLPGGKESMLGLVLYAASIALPLLAAMALFSTHPEKMRAAFAQGFPTSTTRASAASGNARADTLAANQADIERMRAERAARLADADPDQRMSVLRVAVDSAFYDEDYDDALRLAAVYYREASTKAPDTRDHAYAAKSLAYALMESGDVKSTEDERTLLLHEAEAAIRKQLAAGGNASDASLLAEVLEVRANALGPAEAIPLRQEIVEIHANNPGGEHSLSYARVNLAEDLDRSGKSVAAEEQLRTAVFEVRDMPRQEFGYTAYRAVFAHAWFLMAHGRYHEAAAMAGSLRPEDDGRQIASTYMVREVRLIKALAARSRGDWQSVQAEVVQLVQRDEQMPRVTGSWISDFVIHLAYSSPVSDRDAVLLLVEAEHALGQHSSADRRTADLLVGYRRDKDGNPQCRYRIYDRRWRNVLTETLSDIEKREVKCVPAV